jgi:hypothetical protein
MTVMAVGQGKIMLKGACDVGDAEVLVQLLLQDRTSVVDWSACTYAHAAIVQVLLAAEPRLDGSPADDFLAKFVANLLKYPTNAAV